MSTDQEARRVANDPPGQGEPEGPNYIARSVAAKTHWLQRVLSPWTRRWLESGQASPPQAALTVGNTQRLLGRVQRLIEQSTVWQPEAVSLQPAMVDNFAGSIVNRFPALGAKYEIRPAETGPTQTADLVLAGAGEPAPASARPGGQSFQPFPSLEEFRNAVEAKRRSSEGQPAAAEPPRVSQPAQPQVQRAPAEPPKARRLARTLPPGSRPVSRVEEVPPRVEASPTGETLQAEAAPASSKLPPAVQRQTVVAPALPQEKAPPPGLVEAGPPGSSAGSEMPMAQRQPEPGAPGPAPALREEKGPALPVAGVEPSPPPAGAAASLPVVQRQAAETTPGPTQPPEAKEAPPAVASPLPPAAGRATPPAELEMPLVQRQPEPGPASAPAGEPPTRPGPVAPVEAGPPGQPETPPAQAPAHAEAGPPAVQRRAAEEAPAPAPAHAEAGSPAVQRRAAEEAPAQAPVDVEAGPPAGLKMPLVQRQAAEAAPIPAQPAREEAAPPVVEARPPGQLETPRVQRQMAEEAPARAPAYAGEEPPAPPPSGLEMPLAQRQAVEPPRKEVAPAPAGVEPQPSPVIEGAPPAGPDLPLAQRQAVEPPPAPAPPPRREAAGPGGEAEPPRPPVIEEAPPSGPDMPLVQRQAIEPPRKEVAPALAGVEPQPSPVIEGAPPAGPDMPLAQRQAVEPPRQEAAGRGVEAEPPRPPAGEEPPPAGPPMPVVQRQAAPAQPPRIEEAPPPTQVQTAPGEPAAGLGAEVMARATSRERLPLIEPLPPAHAGVIRTKPVEQTAILSQARAQARPEPPASVPSRPGTPPEAGRTPAREIPTQSGWTQAVTGELPLPPALQRSVAPARPVSTASTTLIQRQPEAPAPSPAVTPWPEPRREEVVQRVEGEEPPPTALPPQAPAAGEGAPENLDSLARQIYPLIKRMLAVERERKLGR